MTDRLAYWLLWAVVIVVIVAGASLGLALIGMAGRWLGLNDWQQGFLGGCVACWAPSAWRAVITAADRHSKARKGAK